MAGGVQAWWKDVDPGSLGEVERGVPGWVGQAGNQVTRDEAQWDATLEAVKLFKRTHGRFPKGSGDAEERRLYYWLKDNFTTPTSAPTSSSSPSATAGSPSAFRNPSTPGSSGIY